jgi:hypothetical protein
MCKIWYNEGEKVIFAERGNLMLKTKNKSKLALYILEFISILVSIIGIIFLIIYKHYGINLLFAIIPMYNIFLVVNIFITSIIKIVYFVITKSLKNVIFTLILFLLTVVAFLAYGGMLVAVTGGV